MPVVLVPVVLVVVLLVVVVDVWDFPLPGMLNESLLAFFLEDF